MESLNPTEFVQFPRVSIWHECEVSLTPYVFGKPPGLKLGKVFLINGISNSLCLVPWNFQCSVAKKHTRKITSVIKTQLVGSLRVCNIIQTDRIKMFDLICHITALSIYL